MLLWSLIDPASDMIADDNKININQINNNDTIRLYMLLA